MGMDKEGYSKGAAHDSGENPQRMVAAPTILPLASTTSASGTLGSIPICDVPTKPTTRPDVARPDGLPETIRMEDGSVLEQALECREFAHSTGPYMTVVTTVPEGTGLCEWQTT